MDLFKIIQQLYEEKKRIDKVIGALEDLAKGKSLEGLAADADIIAAASASDKGGPGTPVKRKRGRPRRHPLPGEGSSGSTS